MARLRTNIDLDEEVVIESEMREISKKVETAVDEYLSARNLLPVSERKDPLFRLNMDVGKWDGTDKELCLVMDTRNLYFQAQSVFMEGCFPIASSRVCRTTIASSLKVQEDQLVKFLEGQLDKVEGGSKSLFNDAAFLHPHFVLYRAGCLMPPFSPTSYYQRKVVWAIAELINLFRAKAELWERAPAPLWTEFIPSEKFRFLFHLGSVITMFAKERGDLWINADDLCSALGAVVGKECTKLWCTPLLLKKNIKAFYMSFAVSYFCEKTSSIGKDETVIWENNFEFDNCQHWLCPLLAMGYIVCNSDFPYSYHSTELEPLLEKLRDVAAYNREVAPLENTHVTYNCDAIYLARQLKTAVEKAVVSTTKTGCASNAEFFSVLEKKVNKLLGLGSLDLSEEKQNTTCTHAEEGPGTNYQDMQKALDEKKEHIATTIERVNRQKRKLDQLTADTLSNMTHTIVLKRRCDELQLQAKGKEPTSD